MRVCAVSYLNDIHRYIIQLNLKKVYYVTHQHTHFTVTNYVGDIISLKRVNLVYSIVSIKVFFIFCL